MPARRKLFLTHAGELAYLLVASIAHDAMVMDFVRRYAQRHDRLKVVANIDRLREMESTISREALLLIAAEVRRLLPRAFGLSRNARPHELELCDVFYDEFLQALGRNLEWPLAERETEAQAFRKDLDTYASWARRNSAAQTMRSGLKNGSPFPDRCAILLDSAMMDQARLAAARFQSDLLDAGKRIFDRLGRPTLQLNRTSANKRSAENHRRRRAPRASNAAANHARKHKPKRSRSPGRRR
jgi:hypothetical protein